MINSRATGIASIWLILAMGQSVQAARLLVVTIEHAGQVAQTSFYEDDGTADARTVWSYLGGDPLAVEGGGTIVASAEDPKLARLAGPIVITVSHGKSPLIVSRVVNLNLIRVRPDRDRWYLPPDEIHRTGLAAGLAMDVATPGKSLQFWVGTLGVIVFLVVVFVVAIVMQRVRAVSADS